MTKKYFRWCCILVCSMTFGWAGCVMADESVAENEPAQIEMAEEAPAYQNQAQIAHDANLAEVAYAKIDAEIASLQEDLAKAEVEGDLTEIAALEAEIDVKVSEKIGIEEGKIADLRASGMGWGEIAHELGVHPGVLGLGHSKKSGAINTEREVAMATAIDMKSGMTKGHGFVSDAGSSGTNKDNNGQSKDKGAQGKGGNGKDGDKGNGGGKGGGNGKNK